MKSNRKKVYLLFLLLATKVSCYAQWQEILVGTVPQLQLTSVFFINDSIGFVGGRENSTDTATGNQYSKGILFKTNNGGLTWDTVYFALGSSITNYNIPNAIHFATPLLGYVAGCYGKILRTSDGGNNWQEQIPIVNNGITFNCIYFTDSLTGYASNANSGNNIFIKTFDGGLNWALDTNVSSTDISFPSKNVGYVIGYKTINQTASWTAFAGSPTVNSINCISFINDSTGWMGAMDAGGSPNFNFGVILKTIDGAQTWNRKDYNLEMSRFTDIQFVNDTIGYAIGWARGANYPIWKTIDAGENWYQQQVNFTSSAPALWQISCPSPNVCYTIDYYKNRVYKTTNGGGPLIGVGINETTAPASIPLVVPNPANETISLKNIQPNTLITITNITGNIVLQTTQNQSNQINISHLTGGIYFIKAQSKQTLQIAKFIKE